MKIGDTIADRYRLDGVLGSGGMSRVYRAHDNVLERDVALKVLHDKLSDDPSYVERFRREARAIARLSHPNIVTVIDRGQVDSAEFIVFELVRGANLKQLLSERRYLPVREALAIVHQAARGLAFAHEHGIVHRDVKPQNVLVDDDGAAKVTDFGIARSLDRESGLTQTGAILGTADYLSPEQATGQPVTEAADQYSLGVLLYELLTGEVPYRGESVVAVAARHVNDPVPSVIDRRPDVPLRVSELVERAMAKRPDDRFPSMDAFIAALEAAMAEAEELRGPEGNGATELLPAVAPAPPRQRAREREREREPRRRRRRRAPWPLLAVLLVALAGGAAIWAIADGRIDPSGGNGNAAPAEEVELRAVSDWDPHSDDQSEHPDRVPNATDGNRDTYWTTETYTTNLKEQKPGVGIVFDAGSRVELGGLTVVSAEAGYVALVQAGASPEGPFRPVSEQQRVEGETTFELDTGGEAYRYYLLWIVDLVGRATVNEVRAAD